jgi:hypothetical protein
MRGEALADSLGNFGEKLSLSFRAFVLKFRTELDGTISRHHWSSVTPPAVAGFGLHDGRQGCGN